jgi:renalase
MGGSCLIVGAGLAGLMAARRLTEAGHTVQVVDKGRSVGGRLATRRVGEGRADHGAQFFSVRSPRFQEEVDRWLDLDLAYVWSHGWSDGSLIRRGAEGEGYPRYAIRGGMNALAKHLAQGLDVTTNVRIDALHPAGDGWQAVAEDGRIFTADRVILTAPVPQSLAMLEKGGTALHPEDRAALERIVYAPCVAGIFHVEGNVHLPEPGALQQPGAPIAWVADNQRKGISPNARLITVHAGPTLSQALWETDPDTALDELRTQGLHLFLDPAARILSAQIKRWLYALPEVIHPAPYLLAQDLPPLLCAGDAFGSPRMEGAALSGLAAAEAAGGMKG